MIGIETIVKKTNCDTRPVVCLRQTASSLMYGRDIGWRQRILGMSHCSRRQRDRSDHCSLQYSF